MNFLAHAFLAGSEPADRLGAMLGDFVKGPLPGGLSPGLAAGVSLHRRIDGYADAHEAFCRSRRRVSPLRRRYAGIMVDMFYDHFLALHWHQFGNEPLESFSAGVYSLMEDNSPLLTARLRDLLGYMKRDDWLVSYRSVDSIGLALDRMSRHRLKRENTLLGAVEELQSGYAGFEQDFHDFLPDALAFSAQVRSEQRTCA
jgi:acyl carrier protein phosphodiesterase